VVGRYISLYQDDDEKLKTQKYGIDVTGTTQTDQLFVSGVSTFRGNVDLGDDDILRLGNDNDLQIYHSSVTNNTFIENTTGSLYIRDNGDNVYIQGNGGQNSGLFKGSSSVELYYNNAKKFETSGIGVTVTGQLDTTDLNVAGVSTFVGVSTFQANLFVDGTINSTTAVNVNGVSVVQSAVDEALALAIALG